MASDLVSFALSLVVAAIVVFPLGSMLKKRPSIFYFVAAVLAGLYIYYQYGGLYGNPALQLIAEPLRKGYIASCFLLAVMFCGVMAPHAPMRMRLQPIRAELSILSLIMYLPHIAAYLPAYLPRFAALVRMGNFISYSIITALVLTIIFVLLSLLSLKVFRVKMPFKVWKGIQRLSYAMVILLGVHVWLALGRGALGGGSSESAIALAVYTVVIVTYAILRIRRAMLDAENRAAREATASVERSAVTECSSEIAG